MNNFSISRAQQRSRREAAAAGTKRCMGVGVGFDGTADD
jgi:hypothetical protein